MDPTSDDIQVPGDVLLSMTVDEITEQVHIGPVDSFKLRILFRRKIKGTPVSFDIAMVEEFLKEIKLEQYAKRFEKKQIDGDMLLEADDNILKKIGVAKSIHRLKIRILFPRYVYQKPPSHSCSTVVEWLKSNGMEKHIKKFQDEGIDGDLMLNMDEECLKDLGVDEKGIIIILKLKNNPTLLQGILETEL